MSSPEERLLNLIRGKRPVSPTGLPSATTASPVPTRRPVRVRIRWPFRITPITVVNIALATCLVIGIGWIIVRLVQPVAFVVSTETPSVGAAEPSVAPSTSMPATTSELPAFRERELFQAAPGVATASRRDVATAQQATAQFSLVGIVDGTPPQAIIADAQTQQSYFVREGETFGAGIQVKKITEGRVTLDYQGVQLELHL